MATNKKNPAPVVLVPVDFSDHSLTALRMAAYVAECMRHRIVVLHVVHDPGEMPGYYLRLVKKKRLTRLEDIGAEALDEFLVLARKKLPKNPSVQEATPLLKVGLPVTQILAAIDELKPTMVVMGSQGRTGMEHLMLGSKAEQCVRLSPVPVTVVKAGSLPPANWPPR